jgi:hypothetical protein
MAAFQKRLVGALGLKAAIYEDVEHDRSANWQAGAVVIGAAISNGLGAIRLFGVSGLVRQTLVALVAWVIGSTVLWIVGAKLFPGRNTEGDVGQLLRTLGFAQAPGFFSVLYALPLVGWFVPLGVAAWILLATVVAVRQALDYDSTLRALTVCLVSWLAWLAVTMAGALLGFGVRVA